MYEELSPRSEGWRMMEKLACSKLPRTTYARLLYICICIYVYRKLYIYIHIYVYVYVYISSAVFAYFNDPLRRRSNGNGNLFEILSWTVYLPRK